jgi:hypothetical protein
MRATGTERDRQRGTQCKSSRRPGPPNRSTLLGACPGMDLDFGGGNAPDSSWFLCSPRLVAPRDSGRRLRGHSMACPLWLRGPRRQGGRLSQPRRRAPRPRPTPRRPSRGRPHRRRCRPARQAQELVSAKLLQIGGFDNLQVADKVPEDTNQTSGGFHAMARNSSVKSLGITPVDALRFKFDFEARSRARTSTPSRTRAGLLGETCTSNTACGSEGSLCVKSGTKKGRARGVRGTLGATAAGCGIGTAPRCDSTTLGARARIVGRGRERCPGRPASRASGSGPGKLRSDLGGASPCRLIERRRERVRACTENSGPIRRRQPAASALAPGLWSIGQVGGHTHDSWAR